MRLVAARTKRRRRIGNKGSVGWALVIAFGCGYCVRLSIGRLVVVRLWERSRTHAE